MYRHRESGGVSDVLECGADCAHWGFTGMEAREIVSHAQVHPVEHL